MESKNLDNKNILKIQKMIIYFFCYAFLGWIGEEVLAAITLHDFVKRGFLFGPICPIYGYGALILIIFFTDYKEKPIRLFCLSAIIFTIFEYVTDFFLQALFGIKWWDYTGMFLNLNGRISLCYSLLWGFAGLIFIRYLHPLIKKIIDKVISIIPLKIYNFIPHLLVIILFADTIISSIKYVLLPFASII